MTQLKLRHLLISPLEWRPCNWNESFIKFFQDSQSCMLKISVFCTSSRLNSLSRGILFCWYLIGLPFWQNRSKQNPGTVNCLWMMGGTIVVSGWWGNFTSSAHFMNFGDFLVNSLQTWNILLTFSWHFAEVVILLTQNFQLFLLEGCFVTWM